MVKTSSVRTLALDTASERGSVALLFGSEIVAEFRLRSSETHSARLLRSMEFLLASAGWKLRDIELIAAGIGPGSFTGIRIGLATALGLAQTLDVPFAGVSGLDALARLASLPDGRFGVAMDAQRAQIYYAEYSADRCRLKMVVRPSLWFPADLAARTPHPPYIIGDGASRYLEVLRASGHRGAPTYVETDLYIAGSIGRLALVHKRSWRRGQALNCDPLYIRPPDARKPKRLRS